MSRVSVVIPTYNRARWLPETVASALNQSHRPLEVLIIDDGSTDDTPEVCASFAPPVRYFRQANAGVSAARNHGVQRAHGDWIAFLDSDDLWTREKLEIQLKTLLAHEDAGWSITGCQLIDLGGKPLSGLQGFERAFPLFREEQTSALEFLSSRLERTTVQVGNGAHAVFVGDVFELLFYGNFAFPSTLLLRRDLFHQIGEFDEELRLAEETEFFHRLAAVSNAAIVLSPLLQWRVGQEVSLVSSATTLGLIRNALTSLGRASRLRESLSESERRAYRIGRQRHRTRLAYAHLSLLETQAARTTISEAWRLGLGVSLRSLAIFVATFLPGWALRGLHAAKRKLMR